MMSVMKAAQISHAGGDFELVERPVPQPAPGQVRIRVEACGICHSDAFVRDGSFPGLSYPRIPGHEVAGTVDAVGDGVANWKAGQRVGVGWPSGTAADSEDTLRFSASVDVLPMVETFPLHRVSEAYDRMITARARFRVVLTMA